MSPFAKQYPHLAWWIENHGFIEVGQNGYSRSLLRVLDEGGMCFEDEKSGTVDDALAAGERFLEKELAERFLMKRNAKTGEFEDL